MSRSMKIGMGLFGLAVLATIGLLALGVSQSMSATCEVCVTFNGRTACRSADGATTEEATRTAIQNACAFLAGGMTQTVQCQARQPDSVVCE